MIWVTWRHHRLTLGGAAALLGALGVWLGISGVQLHHAYTAAAACRPTGSVVCFERYLNFDLMNGVLKSGLLLLPLPALVGALVGGPLLARELETGTFRHAWTQGLGRWRWVLAKLGLISVALVAITGAFGWLLTWYYQPYLARGTSPLSVGMFDLRGIAFATWTLSAFAIGSFTGVLTRRVVPAIVVAVAAYTALALLAGIVVRHTSWANHHPAAHFWQLEWIECGTLLALSVTLLFVSAWRVQRRAA